MYIKSLHPQPVFLIAGAKVRTKKSPANLCRSSELLLELSELFSEHSELNHMLYDILFEILDSSD